MENNDISNIKGYIDNAIENLTNVMKIHLDAQNSMAARVEKTVNGQLLDLKEAIVDISKQLPALTLRSELIPKCDLHDKRISSMENKLANLDGKFWAFGIIITMGVTGLRILIDYLTLGHF